MGDVQPNVIVSTRLPLDAYKRVTRMAERKGFVKASGEPHISFALRLLIDEGLKTVEAGGQNYGERSG